jgi:predicted dehydrogenase
VPFTVLLTGLGSIGQRHARNLRTLLGDDVDLLAYRQRRTSPVIGGDLQAHLDRDIEAVYGVRSFDDLDAALAERPDAVFVTNPPHLHVETALAAAEAGAHLLIEKPLASSWDGVERLLEIVERDGLVATVGYQLRFHPGFLALRDLLARDDLGNLLGARVAFGEYLPGWHPWEDHREGNAARSDQGGGVVLAQIHDLDVVYAFFGTPKRVFASGGARSTLRLDVEDAVGMLLDYDGLPVMLYQDLLQRPPLRTYEVLGEEGRALWDYYGNDIVVLRPDGSRERQSFEGFDRNTLFVDELRHFIACVEGREQPVVGLREGADSLRIALAARESLGTGQAVALP